MKRSRYRRRHVVRRAGKKLCGACDRWLAPSAFHGGNKNAPDGLQGRCKLCQTDDKRIRRAREADRRDPLVFA